MKHLNPALEKLEQRIAPCLPPLLCVGLCGGGGGGGESGASCSNGSGSSASGSQSSKSKSRESCSS